MEADVNKLGTNKLVNIPNGLNNLKAKVDDLDVEKVKSVSLIWKKCWFEEKVM